MSIKQSEEKEYMAEWRETHIKIDDWLTSAENEAVPFDKAHEYIIDVEAQVAEHEVISVWKQLRFYPHYNLKERYMTTLPLLAHNTQKYNFDGKVC